MAPTKDVFYPAEQVQRIEGFLDTLASIALFSFIGLYFFGKIREKSTLDKTLKGED